MRHKDAPPSEMPEFTRQTRLPAEQRERALDMLLDGLPLPPDAPPEMSALPTMLADLTAPASPAELAAEAAVLSRFQHSFPPARTPRAHPAHGQRARRRPRGRLAAHRARVTVIAMAAAAGLGGTAAAYAGVLPAPVQTFAHQVIGAPPTSPARPASGTRGGPASRSPAAAPGGTGPARAHSTPGDTPRSSPVATPQPERSPSPSPSRSWPSQATQPGRPSQASHSTGPHRPAQSRHHASASSRPSDSSHATGPAQAPATPGGQAPAPENSAAVQPATSHPFQPSPGHGHGAPPASTRAASGQPGSGQGRPQAGAPSGAEPAAGASATTGGCGRPTAPRACAGW